MQVRMVMFLRNEIYNYNNIIISDITCIIITYFNDNHNDNYLNLIVLINFDYL